MTKTIPEDALHLLDEANFAHVVTLMDDGAPQVTPVWIDRDGQDVLFNTTKGRVKHRNLEQDPRIALSMTGRENPYEYLQVRGRATFEEKGADAHIDALAKKYLGVDEYPMRQEGEERVIVRVTPEAVTYQGG